jgi:proteasome accessory factor B
VSAKPARPSSNKSKVEAKKGPKRAGHDKSGGGGAGARDDRGKRLLDLVVMLLGARQPVPYREIRAQFRAYRTENEEAGLRAFERDKADLLELGVPLRYVTADDDDGVDEAGYVVDLRRYRLPEIHLLPDEVAALVLAGSVARAAPGTTYAEVVDLALKKLAFDAAPPIDSPGAPVETSRRPREPVLVHFPTTGAGAEKAAELAERLAEIEQAIRFRKRVSFAYTSAAAGESTSRDVDPYGLVSKEGTWHLVGHCHLRNGIRTFRLDRMASLIMAPKPKSPDFERPASFDVRSYAARSPWTYQSEPEVVCDLDVLPPATAVADEDFGAGAERTPLPGGGVRVRFRCSNPDFVLARVLEHKGALVVRAPQTLISRVQGELVAVAARYRQSAASEAPRE